MYGVVIFRGGVYRILYWMKGRRSTKMGIRVRTMKSRKFYRVRSFIFRRVIFFIWRFSQYYWFFSCFSKQTRIIFSVLYQEKRKVSLQICIGGVSFIFLQFFMYYKIFDIFKFFLYFRKFTCIFKRDCLDIRIKMCMVNMF